METTLGQLGSAEVGQVVSFRYYRGVIKDVTHYRGATSSRPVTKLTLLYREGSRIESAAVDGDSSTVCAIHPEGTF